MQEEEGSGFQYELATPLEAPEKITITNLFEDSNRFVSECKSDASVLDVACHFPCRLDSGL
jgi:hypothetical protein